MKKVILLSAVVLFAACGSPKVEEAAVSVDTTVVAADSCQEVSPVVSDTATVGK